MNSLEAVCDKLKAELEKLSAIPQLPAGEALARANAIVILGGDDAVALERQGRYSEVATLYDMFARSFEIAAQKVPEEDRWQLASLGDYWSLKARTARLTPTPAVQSQPPHPVEQRRDPISERPTLKLPRQGTASVTDDSKPSIMINVRRAADSRKTGEVQTASWTAAQPSPLPSESGAPSAAGQADASQKPGKEQTKRSSGLHPLPRPSEAGMLSSTEQADVSLKPGKEQTKRPSGLHPSPRPSEGSASSGESEPKKPK